MTSVVLHSSTAAKRAGVRARQSSVVAQDLGGETAWARQAPRRTNGELNIRIEHQNGEGVLVLATAYRSGKGCAPATALDGEAPRSRTYEKATEGQPIDEWKRQEGGKRQRLQPPCAAPYQYVPCESPPGQPTYLFLRKTVDPRESPRMRSRRPHGARFAPALGFSVWMGGAALV